MDSCNETEVSQAAAALGDMLIALCISPFKDILIYNYNNYVCLCIYVAPTLQFFLDNRNYYYIIAKYRTGNITEYL